MKLSYVIVTHNRRDALLKTLKHLHENTPLPRDQWEVWVVDNASTDGTDVAVRAYFECVNYVMRETNEGVWARSVAFGPAKGEYLILLDDDSYPIGDAVTRSLGYLDKHADCGAVVGKVVLPEGGEEGAAFPAVMLSGAVCIRKKVLSEVGGFRPEFFRKAGEYDLSYRMWAAGYSVVRLEDVVYRHDKVMTGRSKPFAHRMDLRNNLILVERYLPKGLRKIYRRDVTQRYSALARHEGCSWAAWQARAEGLIWRMREAVSGRQTLKHEVVEKLYQIEAQAEKVTAFARGLEEEGLGKRVVIADFSKNLWATYQACVWAGLEVVAIADDHPAYQGLSYRGVKVLPVKKAVGMDVDGVVVSNINPAQCRQKADTVKKWFTGAVLLLWEPTSSDEGEALRRAA